MAEVVHSAATELPCISHTSAVEDERSPTRLGRRQQQNASQRTGELDEVAGEIWQKTGTQDYGCDPGAERKGEQAGSEVLSEYIVIPEGQH